MARRQLIVIRLLYTFWFAYFVSLTRGDGREHADYEERGISSMATETTTTDGSERTTTLTVNDVADHSTEIADECPLENDSWLKCQIPTVSNGRLIDKRTKMAVDASEQVNVCSSLTLSCDTNFTAAGGVTTIRCEPNFKLNVTNIECIPNFNSQMSLMPERVRRDCQVPQVPNGFLTDSISTPFVSGEIFPSGSILRVNCDGNFVATVFIIKCSDGQWDSTNIACEPIDTTTSTTTTTAQPQTGTSTTTDATPTLRPCSVPALTNGVFVRSRDRSVLVGSGESVSPGSILVLVCINNFIATTFSIQCGVANGDWNATNVACLRSSNTFSSRSTARTKATATMPQTSYTSTTLRNAANVRCGRAFSAKSLFYGKNIAEQGSQPWMSLLNVTFDGDARNHIMSVKRSCGGGLIAPDWVLTAAHCLTNSQNKPIRRIDVLVGKSVISCTEIDEEQRYSVATYIHPSYTENNGRYDYDFALVKLNSVVNVSSLVVRQICLPDPSMCSNTKHDDETSPVVDGCDHVAATGWETEGSIKSPYLKQVPETIVPRDKCQLASALEINERMICSMVPNSENEQICGSGGMLICRNDTTNLFYMTGVASFTASDRCGAFNSPTVYSRVCSALQWIRETANIL